MRRISDFLEVLDKRNRDVSVGLDGAVVDKFCDLVQAISERRAKEKELTAFVEDVLQPALTRLDAYPPEDSHFELPAIRNEAVGRQTEDDVPTDKPEPSQGVTERFWRSFDVLKAWCRRPQ